ncbi:MAG TPA: hypothetical protein VGS27_09675 [Candidatus Sulfotelmatobacter sp.]|nr:hypothetical protein [Candidatus Sulfotelmatobacter sp.]
MKKLALLFVLALELAVCGCGTSPNTSTTTFTSTNSSWEAMLYNGTGQDSLLNFIVTFAVNTTGPLNVTQFAFFNQGSCFGVGLNQAAAAGTMTLNTANNGQVTGTFTLTVTSSTNGTVLKLFNGSVSGTSNGTTSTTGILSNGMVTGNWSLTPGANTDKSCAAVSKTAGATFVMCQGNTTCSASAASIKETEKL